MATLRLVVFDLAGTTVRDRGEVAGAFVAALAGHGIEVTPERLASVRGSSKRQAIAALMPEGPGRAHAAQAAYALFREHLARAYRAQGVSPVDGAERVFRQLRARGVRVALNTGFDRDITRLLTSSLGWDDGVVDAVVCGDDVPAGRPAPYLIFRAMEATSTCDVREVANVGDTLLDLQAGHNAGVGWNLAVLSGAHDRATLERAPHSGLIDSIADLEAVLIS